MESGCRIENEYPDRMTKLCLGQSQAVLTQVVGSFLAPTLTVAKYLALVSFSPRRRSSPMDPAAWQSCKFRTRQLLSSSDGSFTARVYYHDCTYATARPPPFLRLFLAGLWMKTLSRARALPPTRRGTAIVTLSFRLEPHREVTVAPD